MSRERADDNQHLPPWLRDVPLPPRPPSLAAPASAPPAPWSGASTPAPDQPEEIPDWLKDLSQADLPEAPAADALPPWPAESPEDMPPDDDIPDWLRDSRADSTPPTPQEAHLPDWLRGSPIEPSAEPRESAEPLPSWLTGLTAEEPMIPSPAQSGGSSAEALPEWLRETDSADEPPAPPEDSHAGLWPGAEAPAEAAAPAGRAEDSAPPELPDLGDSGIPSWLRDIPSDEIRRVMEGEEEDITVEPFSFDEPSGPRSGEPAPDAPAWLSGISETAGEDLAAGPSWLSGLSDEPIAQAGASSPPDVPLWLQDLGEPAASAPGASTEAPPPPSDSLPGWLGEAEQAQPEADALPAWLREESSDRPPAEELPTWLQAGPPATPPGESPALTADSLPAWLQAEPPATPAADAAPDWLRKETTDKPPAEELPTWLQAEPPAAPAADAIPDWLRVDATPPPSTPPDTPAAQELPPWLSDAITSTPTPEPIHVPPADQLRRGAPAPPASADEELPAWLRDDTPVSPPAEELPPWLQSSPPAISVGPESVRDNVPAPPADDLPPWLRDDAGQPLPTAGPPGDTNLPEWLRGEAPFGGTPERIAPVSPDRPRAPVPPSLDWFGEDESSGAPARAPAGESEFFGSAELPAWLRKADTEPAAEISAADARSLDWLTKLGAHEEEIAGVISAPAARTIPLPQAPARSESQVRALTLLQRLAAEPYPAAAPLPAAAEKGLWQRIGLERLLYIVLLVALLAALAMPGLATGLQSPPEAPGASELFQQIDTLTDRDVVLVGYEWDARRMSELKPLEQAVIGQLIQKHVKLVLVSTDPQGSLLLFDLRDDLQAAGYKEGGEDYILLGYKPGGELALRSLAQDFQAALRSDFQGSDATISALAGGLQTGKPLVTLSDFSMLLVLSDDAADVQSWVEQIYRSVPQKPLAFLLPAETEPIVEPYLQPPRNPQYSRIYHLAGKQGALAYEQLRGADHTASVQIEREIGQQRLGILVFVALLAIGAIVVGISGAMRRGGA